MSTINQAVNQAIVSAPHINGGIKPGIPEETKNFFNKIYTMYYIHQRSHHAEPFYFDGDPKAARDKALQFCQAMNFRLLYVLPFLKDIDKELAKKSTQVITKDVPQIS